MSQQQSKREFWINDVTTQEFGEIPVAFKHHKNIKGSIHVIEYSAYEQLLCDARKLRDVCMEHNHIGHDNGVYKINKAVSDWDAKYGVSDDRQD